MHSKRINVNQFLLAVILAMTAVLCGSARAEEVPGKVSKELRGKAVDVLRQTLDQEHRWVKVHAAEFLLKLDYPQGVAEVFAGELAEFENEPEYRVGVWRVLARAAEDDEQRTRWTEKIRGVFLDDNAPDRTHAVETLAKLGYTIRREGDKPFQRDAWSDAGLSAMFVRWATGFGTIVGAAFGLATVVAINFWEEMTGTKGISFLWAMPLGLLVQVLVGSIASLMPVGRR